MSASDFNENIQQSMKGLQRIWALYHDERDGAQWTRRGDMPAVSSSGKSDPTGQVAVVERREKRADNIANDAGWLTAKIMEIISRYEPKQTGECRTEGCIREGISSWDGRCEKCGPWIEHHQRRGLDVDPADQNGLVEQWNSQAVRYCGCNGWTCPVCGLSCCQDRCHDKIEPDGTSPRMREPMSARCRARQSRHRQEHEEIDERVRSRDAQAS